MRRHVHAVGQKRHGAEDDAGDDLDHHEGGREIDHEARPRLGAAMASAEIDVIVRPGVVVTIVHDKRNIGRSLPLRYAPCSDPLFVAHHEMFAHLDGLGIDAAVSRAAVEREQLRARFAVEP